MLQLGRFPRVRPAYLPTPLEPMTRLSAHLVGPKLWIKRDDCAGLRPGKFNENENIVFLQTGGQARPGACAPALAA